MLLFCLSIQKKRGVIVHNNEIIGKEIGTVFVHMYKDIKTDSPFFYIESDNKKVSNVSDIIEDTLKLY